MLGRQPDNVLALVLRANALAGQKRAAAALADINRAIELDPTRSDTYANRGLLQGSAGDFVNGEASLLKAIAADPMSARPRVLLASIHWALGAVDKAEAELIRAVAAQPGDFAAHRALAALYLGANRVPEAEPHLRAIADNQGTVGARMALADYYIVVGRSDQASAVLIALSADQTQPGYADARSRLAAMAYAAGRTTEAHGLLGDLLALAHPGARALMTKAQFLAAENKLDEGLTFARRAANVEPGSVAARYLLATVLAARQDTDAAVAEFTEVIRLDPDSIPARIELARLHLARGESAAAVARASQAAASQPASLDARLLLVRALVAGGEISRAAATLKPLLDVAAPLAQTLTLAGTVNRLLGEEVPARQYFLRAAAADPEALEPVAGLVALSLTSGATAAARTLVESRLAKQPSHSGLLVLAARIYGDTGDAARAEATLRKALQADPANPLPYMMLGAHYAARNDLNRALGEFERLVALDPGSVAANTMLALLLQELRRLPEAEARYQRVFASTEESGARSGRAAAAQQ